MLLGCEKPDPAVVFAGEGRLLRRESRRHLLGVWLTVALSWACAPQLDSHLIAAHPPVLPKIQRPQKTRASAEHRPAWLQKRASTPDNARFVGHGSAEDRRTALARARRDFDRQIAGFVGLKVRTSFSSEESYERKNGQDKRTFKARSEQRAQLRALMKIEPQQRYWEERRPPLRYDAYVFASVPKRALRQLRAAGRLSRASRGRPLLRVRFGDAPLARAMESEVIGAFANSAAVFAVREDALEAALLLQGAARASAAELSFEYTLKRKDGQVLAQRSFRGDRRSLFELQERLIEALAADVAAHQAVARRGR